MGETTYREPRKRNKLAIVGCAPTTRTDAPFEDNEFDMWGVNELDRTFMPEYRWDAWFDPHPLTEVLPANQEYYRKLKIPIYMQGQFADIPMSRAYPFREVFAWCGQFDFVVRNGKTFRRDIDDNFASTIQYMLAFGILCGYPEIHMYGIEMAATEEYAYQAKGMAYLTGLARGLGVKVVLPFECTMLKVGFVYGLQSWPYAHAINPKAFDPHAFQKIATEADAEAQKAAQAHWMALGVKEGARKCQNEFLKPLRQGGFIPA